VRHAVRPKKQFFIKETGCVPCETRGEAKERVFLINETGCVRCETSGEAKETVFYK